MTGRLTAAIVRGVKEPGKYGDGGTLYLRVAPGGSKAWVQRLAINGKRRDIGLGGYPVVSLAEARDQAFNNRRLVRRGGDPLAQKRKAQVSRIPCFRDAADAAIKSYRGRWRSDKTARNWRMSLERYVFPPLGDMRLDAIGQADVLRILTPIWTGKPELARKIRQRIRAVLSWGQAHGHIEHNVAGEAISAALPVMPKVKAHLRAMPYRKVGAAMEVIEGSRASLSAKTCLRLVILTAVRSGEARLATWAEIDFEAKEWRIPGERMKAGREHRVPLSEAALDGLERIKKLNDGFGVVFPSPLKRGRPLSDMTLTKVLRDTGLADHATVHGFRSSFRDWCAETGKPREIAEAALAHVVGGVEGAYFRSDLFQKRRILMDAWARYLTKQKNPR